MLHQTGREAALTPSMARTVCVLRLKAESVSGKLRARPDVPRSRRSLIFLVIYE